MRTFICTVGTSLAENSGLNDTLREKLNKSLPDVTEGEDVKRARELLAKATQNARQREDRLKLAAELNSLLNFQPALAANDVVVLLYADNMLGKLCAEGLKKALVEYVGLKEADVELERVKGLQVYDFKQFRKDGLRNFFDLTINRLEAGGLTVDNPDHKYTAEFVLNPTGGYKALVPYMTLLGTLFGQKVIYIFEEADALITLPAVPLRYDAELMKQAYPLLNRLENSEELGVKAIPASLLQADFLDVLVEEDGGLLFPTALGQLFYRRYLHDNPIKLEDVPTSQLAPDRKPIKLRDDHGKVKLQALGKRLVESPFVKGVINSSPFSPTERARIPLKQSFEKGLVEIALTSDDRGLGMVVETTGRNPGETRLIAEHLEEKYAW